MTRKNQEQHLQREIRADLKVHAIMQCCICDEMEHLEEVHRAQNPTIEDYVELLVDQALELGWRYKTSKKYGLEGFMCPNCAKKRDYQR